MRPPLVLVLITVLSRETLEQNDDITSLIQSMLDVDRALEKEIKDDVSRAKEKQHQLSSEFLNNLNRSVNTLKDALNEQFSKLQDNQQTYKEEEHIQKRKLIEEWKSMIEEINNTSIAWQRQEEAKIEKEKEDIHELLDQLKMAYEERKEQKATEKKQKREQFRQSWERVKGKIEELQSKLNDAIKVKKEHRKKMMESMRATLLEIKTILEEQKAIRDQRMQRRRDEYWSALDQIKSEIVALKDDLDAREEELNEKRAQFKQKQHNLKDILHKALKQSVEASALMKLGEKLQDAMDKKMLEEIVLRKGEDEKRNKTVPVATKATILDEITGVSAWQTVTWILLTICILLCVALVTIIIYQMTQRNKYQLLHGSDHAEEPIPVARPIMSPGYMEVRKTSMPHVSSDPKVPYGEIHQF